MKKIIYIILFYMILVSYSCQNNTHIKRLTLGTWNVVEFADKPTTQHNRYLLKFKPDNTVSASFKQVMYNGTWSTSSNDVTDDEPMTEKDISINFSRGKALNIIGSYKIMAQTAGKIILERKITNDTTPLKLELQKIN